MAPLDEEDGDGGQSGLSPFPHSHEFPPPSSTVQVTFGAHTRRGRSRLINEDHYLVFRLGRWQETLMTTLPRETVDGRFDEYAYAMVVADGLGDTGAGEAASHLALSSLVHLVRHFSAWNLRVDDATAREIMARAERFYRHIDSAVMYQRRQGVVATDQTTLTATFSAGRDLFFAHVGHSRAYLLRGRQLMRLTRDHTMDRYKSTSVPLGPLMDVNATARDLRHILTDTIGMSGPSGPTIDLERIQLENDDRVLTCTNGITDVVDEEDIAKVLGSDHTPDAQSQSLVELAIAAGGEDDATAVVARYWIPT
jgi:serine/threonine protein phosphatase PrpC